MIKRVYVISGIALFCACGVFAKQDNVTVVDNNPVEVADSTAVKVVEKDLPPQTVTNNAEVDSLRKELEKSLQNLKKVTAEKDSLVKVNHTMQKLLDANSYNFLFVPYESYNVEKLAKYNYKYITDPKILENARLPKLLLENYKSDVRAISDFIKPIPAKFEINTLQLESRGAKLASELNALPTVSSYKQLEGWQKTYLGKHITNISMLLKSLNLNNLEKNLKTLIEISKTLDESIKK